MIKSILILLVVFCTSIYAGSLAQLLVGKPVDTLKRFPHHVTIHVTPGKNDTERHCSGSIINEQWIISSISCVRKGIQLRLDFHRLYLNKAVESFSLTIDYTAVTPYPTEYDDLVLIKLPISLKFSSSLKAIALYRGQSEFTNKLVVMPGFNNTIDKLEYGMFRMTDARECESLFGDSFDKYLHLCVQAWDKKKHVPCAGNEGGGLIVGWPAKPQLVGIFSSYKQCKHGKPAIYTKIFEYIDWIDSVIGSTLA